MQGIILDKEMVLQCILKNVEATSITIHFYTILRLLQCSSCTVNYWSFIRKTLLDARLKAAVHADYGQIHIIHRLWV